MFIKTVSTPFSFPFYFSSEGPTPSTLDIGTPTRFELIKEDTKTLHYHFELSYEVEAPSELSFFVESLDGPILSESRTWRDFSDFVNAQQKEAWRRKQLVFNGLQWRCGAAHQDGPPGETFVSVCERKWHKIPRWAVSAQISIMLKRQTDEVLRAVTESLALSQNMPVSRELYLEAYGLKENNPRSSLVLLVAAAEVGFKELVSTLVPDAAWLISKMPSPPLRRMISDYLPTLPVKAKLGGMVLKPPKAIRRALSEADERRNEVVHAGRGIRSGEELDGYLSAVNDFLYLLDAYAGNIWAWEYVSLSTKLELTKEASEEKSET